jgi:hypothetical protein
MKQIGATLTLSNKIRDFCLPLQTIFFTVCPIEHDPVVSTSVILTWHVTVGAGGDIAGGAGAGLSRHAASH